MGTQIDPPPRDGDTSRTSVRSKVAELLALRDSISESAVSLDKFADEDAVREHVLRPALSSSQMVLRPSASVPAFSKPLKSTSTLGGSSTALNQTRNASDAAIMSSMSSRSGNQKKPSPSPSIKRNKVERLIKEHGSPPGIRVTAGGRIVPSDLRLGSPSFPVDNGSANSLNRGSGRIDRAPFDLGRSSSSMNSMSSMPVNHPAANVGYNQYAFQPSPALMQYYGYQSHLPYAWTPTQPRAYAAPEVPQTVSPSLTDLKKAFEKLQHEQRELERNMVIQENAITADERKKMVEEKIRMITEADKIRKEIKRLEGEDKGAQTSASSSSDASLSDSKKQSKPIGAQKPSDFVNPSAGIGLSSNPFLYSTPPPGYMPYPPPPPSTHPQFIGVAPGYSAFPNQGFNGLDANTFASTDSLPNPEVNVAANGQNKHPHKSSGHAARKSHALEIKDPRTLPDLGKNKRSALDPTSPAYTPQKQDKFDDRNGESSPTTSPQRAAQAAQLASNFPWLCDKKADGPSPMRSATSSAHRPSASSINTADFFPHNPHEHSSSNYVNRKTQPVTPEKSKWNHGLWNSDYLSPDPAQALKAPQVSPVNGITTNMNALALHRGSEALVENGRLPVPRNISKQHSDKASIYTRRSSRKHLKESKTPAASTSGTLDFRSKSTGFLMGFSAGLAGQSVMGTEDLDFMQGWAQGLVQAKRSQSQDGSNTEASDSSMEEDDFQFPIRPPVAFQSQAETSNRQVSTATIRPAPGPIERPAPGVFDSFSSERSIISDMGFNAPTPKKLKAMSGQSAAIDASIRDKIDSILTSNTPIKKISGNEAEPQKNDKSEHSPSKLTRVFSGSQHSQPKGQRFSLNCLGDQRSQNRNMRLSYDGQYDDDMAELEGAFPTPQSPKGESATRSTPSKFLTGPSETTGTPSAGSPKRFKLSPSKDKPKNLKPEMEDPANMNAVAKKKWTEGWRKKFSQIKANEEDEVATYRAQNPLGG